MSTDELLAEALRLTRVDRARVVEELLSSLEESTRSRHGMGGRLERRSRDVAEGRVQRPAGTPRAPEILKELDKRRPPPN